jgi:deoxyribonuclease-4
MAAKFGPHGRCDFARERGVKTTEGYLALLAELGLDAYEYPCGRGVNVGEETARAIGREAKRLGIQISLHSPYYVSLASIEESKRLNSVQYLLKSAAAVDWMGGTRVTVHPGGLNGQTREKALQVAADTLRSAQRALDEAGLSHIVLCPETMGKVSQLGDLDEVLALCAIDERMLPCVDFGHLNARTQGGLRVKEAYSAVFRCISGCLGEERARKMHAHFSKIEYSAGGEVRHLTFTDCNYGPEFEPLMELTAKWNYEPVFICESAGTQAQDAARMKQNYEEALKNGE